MKVIRLNHPEQTCQTFIETTCQGLAKDWRLHSQVYLPGQILGVGHLVLFFEERPKFKVHQFPTGEG